MNYYEHHLGDYMRDTAHLSMIEDAAYRRLLDAYYVRERALPADLAECCKLARASSKPERDAVAYVLREFFELRGDGHHQDRADREIARYQGKQPEAQRKREHATERQRRAREHRRQLFEQLRERGIVPPYDTQTAELVTLLSHAESRARHAPVTRDITATTHQTPVPRHQTPNTGETDAHSDPPRAPAASGPEPPAGGGVCPPTMAGAVCVALRASGMARANPAHPKLLALIGQGASVDAFVAAWHDAQAGGRAISNPFAYVLGVVQGQMTEARQVANGGTVVPLRPPRGETYRERDDRLAREHVASLTGRAVAPPTTVIDVEATVRRIAE